MTIIPKYFEKHIINAGKNIHSPEQRLIVGVTALATQPFIDLNNKKADENTRVLSACKTTAKIIAGTTSGVLIRGACIKIIDKLSGEGKLLNPEKLFGPGYGITDVLSKQKLDNYVKNLGTASAILIMVATNFLWDAPVTKKLTNFFNEKVSKREAK